MDYERLMVQVAGADHELIRFAGEDQMIDGLIFADPFCPKRQPQGICDLPGLFREAKAAGLFVSYQTPVYLTSRNFDCVNSLVGRLAAEGILDELRIQDLGMLQSARQLSAGKFSITWSAFGWQKEFPDMDFPLNQGQVDFLVEGGVDSFEITPGAAWALITRESSLDFKKQIHHYPSRELVSFSRTCYNELFTGCWCESGEGRETLPCGSPLYVQDQEEQGPRYLVEGHQIWKHDSGREFEKLLNHDGAALALVLETGDREQLSRELERLERSG